MNKHYNLYGFVVILVITILSWVSMFDSSSSSSSSNGRGGSYYGGGYSGGGHK